MADIAALQLPTKAPRGVPASFPTSPHSPQSTQVLWRCSASSLFVQRETFENRRALSAVDSLKETIDNHLGGRGSGQ